MADNVLIDSYLAELGRGLPPAIVDELADGVIEAYEHHLERGCGEETAARAALAEFGSVTDLVAEFTRQSAGRRTARELLVTGPVVGLCWGAALIVTQAWTWPVPMSARIAFGSGLLLAVAALIGASTSRGSFRRTRLAALGGIGLVILDATLIVASSLAVRTVSGILLIAVAASLARVGLTVRSLPHVLAR